MRFQQFAPPTYLSQYIRYFWLLESTGESVEVKTFRMIADGYPGLIFQQTDQSLFRDQAQKEWPRALLYGQTVSPGDIQMQGPVRTLGVYFHPSALTTIFGFNADQLTDACLDLTLLSTRLPEQLLNTESVVHQIQVIADYLGTLIQRNKLAADPQIQHALQQLQRSGGHIALPALQQSLSISERSFQRRFKQQVGIAPNLFSRICRFQVALNQLRSRQYQKLSDVAFENDYADQSHFIRAFQEFAGCSPYQYQKRANELVANFPELIR
ncbi:AraC family transcriptional regulator [Hymenobacter tibetensis]|uniref:AraC family transcriptional regulator n=1 Tax=Hymenobacter tibetensis TaxID=497967 RepID=A0ABY4D3F6_9BACT|nr:helix-turn-helix domain-containing protein [Hymenobacter tibetensis]UOG76831.1 AraC family transcriptional regulator [Hymenobacter tibetensis]